MNILKKIGTAIVAFVGFIIFAIYILGQWVLDSLSRGLNKLFGKGE